MLFCTEDTKCDCLFRRMGRDKAVAAEIGEYYAGIETPDPLISCY